MLPAVFLDRDGVINRLVLNPATGEYESPHHAEDLELFPWTIEALRILQQIGYRLFLISNQPSYAKGKTSIENILAVHDKMHRIFGHNGIVFTDYFYCYHHPNGVVPELTIKCNCRKPGRYFLEQAHRNYCFAAPDSWLIGDQVSDIVCGQSFGLKTILINDIHSKHKRAQSNPDYFADDLLGAVRIIIEKKKEVERCTGISR